MDSMLAAGVRVTVQDDALRRPTACTEPSGLTFASRFTVTDSPSTLTASSVSGTSLSASSSGGYRPWRRSFSPSVAFGRSAPGNMVESAARLASSTSRSCRRASMPMEARPDAVSALRSSRVSASSSGETPGAASSGGSSESDGTADDALPGPTSSKTASESTRMRSDSASAPSALSPAPSSAASAPIASVRISAGTLARTHASSCRPMRPGPASASYTTQRCTIERVRLSTSTSSPTSPPLTAQPCASANASQSKSSTKSWNAAVARCAARRPSSVDHCSAARAAASASAA
mmetsp:Transcript_13066/g.54731  ORF Transcript_13066/g.54731 Transcript_13066/m.54731 type:complete len:292 (-) Transcript_13066:125-1000(-)